MRWASPRATSCRRAFRPIPSWSWSCASPPGTASPCRGTSGSSMTCPSCSSCRSAAAWPRRSARPSGRARRARSWRSPTARASPSMRSRPGSSSWSCATGPCWPRRPATAPRWNWRRQAPWPGARSGHGALRRGVRAARRGRGGERPVGGARGAQRAAGPVRARHAVDGGHAAGGPRRPAGLGRRAGGARHRSEPRPVRAGGAAWRPPSGVTSSRGRRAFCPTCPGASTGRRTEGSVGDGDAPHGGVAAARSQAGGAHGGPLFARGALKARYEATATAIRASLRQARGRVESTARRALHVRDVLLPAPRRKALDETVLQYNAMQVGVFSGAAGPGLRDGRGQHLCQRRCSTTTAPARRWS